jgi:hypothetical protein
MRACVQQTPSNAELRSTDAEQPISDADDALRPAIQPNNTSSIPRYPGQRSGSEQNSCSTGDERGPSDAERLLNTLNSGGAVSTARASMGEKVG